MLLVTLTRIESCCLPVTQYYRLLKFCAFHCFLCRWSKIICGSILIFNYDYNLKTMFLCPALLIFFFFWMFPTLKPWTVVQHSYNSCNNSNIFVLDLVVLESSFHQNFHIVLILGVLLWIFLFYH